MTNRLRCPGCGIPTIEDGAEDITREEMLCDVCMARETLPEPYRGPRQSDAAHGFENYGMTKAEIDNRREDNETRS